MENDIFNIGDSIVCVLKDKTPYDAKVIAIKEYQGQQHYIVHFVGWNSRYDEKIPFTESSGRMFKCTIEQYRKNHQGEPSEPKAKKKRVANAVDNGQPVATKATKTSTASDASDETAESVREEAPTSSTPRTPKRKVDLVASQPVLAGEQTMFVIGEDCVCLQGNDPYPAKVADIKEFQGVQKYIVHFVGWNHRYDQKITVGEEAGKMFKETLQEYNSKYGGETSGPAPKKKTAKKVVHAEPVQVDPPNKEFTITTITPDHAEYLIGMIHELAEFERMRNSVINSVEQLRRDIKNKAVHGFIAFDGDEPAGMNLFYYAYSTWVGQYIHMEDLYVRPQFRRQGLARTLWKKLAQLAKEKQIVRLEWAVLDWNKDAIALYDTTEYVNLTKDQGWYTFRMDGAAINTFADE